MTIRYHRVGYRVERLPEHPVPDPDTCPDDAPATLPLRPTTALLLDYSPSIRERFARNIRRDAAQSAALWTRRVGWRAQLAQGVRHYDCGADVLRAREASGLSQRDLSRHLHISRGLLADCERGRRSVPGPLWVWAWDVLARLEPASPAQEERNA